MWIDGSVGHITVQSCLAHGSHSFLLGLKNLREEPGKVIHYKPPSYFYNEGTATGYTLDQWFSTWSAEQNSQGIHRGLWIVDIFFLLNYEICSKVVLVVADYQDRNVCIKVGS